MFSQGKMTGPQAFTSNTCALGRRRGKGTMEASSDEKVKGREKKTIPSWSWVGDGPWREGGNNGAMGVFEEEGKRSCRDNREFQVKRWEEM